MYVNDTGYEFVDVPKDIITNAIGGDVISAVLILSGLVIIALLIIGARKEAVALVPLPALVTVADSIGVTWVKVVMWMIAGFYLAGLIFALSNVGDK